MPVHNVNSDAIEWEPIRGGTERKKFSGDGATMALRRIRPGNELGMFRRMLAQQLTGDDSTGAAHGKDIPVVALTAGTVLGDGM